MKNLKKALLASAVIAFAPLAACTTQSANPDVQVSDVKQTYADMALAMYQDSLSTALTLQAHINAFVAAPTEANLAKAKQAWLAARVPYQQTEGYRFGNAYVDEWEGKVNAWPLDEGLIDYVDSSYGKSSDENPLYTLNVVAHNTFNIGGRTVNATEITPKLLAEELHEAQEVEANVATGYHAIEFLLWGQDLNGTNAGAGNRKASDFDVKNCTNGHCDRRVQYLVAATDLLVSDLQDIVAAWGTGGQARTDFMNKTDAESLSTILTGLGSLSYGELAGERIKLGLMLNDPEEEHDCFSDNTHNSHYYDEVGMKAIYTGVYRRVDGSVFKGPALKDYAEIHAPAANAKALAGIETAMSKMTTMKRIADSGEMAYDQMIGAGNTKGNAVVMDVVNSLVVQTRGFEAVVAGLNLNIEVEGSDSLDNPSAVQ